MKYTADVDEQFYREQILDHYRHPRNAGVLDPADAQAAGKNPFCGDEIRVTLRLDGGLVSELAFAGRGCAISQAAASMLSEEIVGRPIEEVAAYSRDEILELLGITVNPSRLKCAVLGLGAVKRALHDAAGTPLPAEWATIDGIEWE